MTDKHDFKEIHKNIGDWFYYCQEGNKPEYKHPKLTKDQYLTIQKALRIADRLQSGEVSEKSIKKGLDKFSFLFGFKNETYYMILKKSFKAMTEQLIKECEDEL